MDIEIAEERAIVEMEKHGLIKLGWSFHWAKGRKTFGTCVYRKKQIRLSFYLTHVNTEEEVADTILHEIAHALTPGDGHGPKWRAKCVEIGARPERCYMSKTEGGEVVLATPMKNTTQKRYQTVCNSCGKVTRENNRKRNVQKLMRRHCKWCGPTSSLRQEDINTGKEI